MAGRGQSWGPGNPKVGPRSEPDWPARGAGQGCSVGRSGRWAVKLSPSASVFPLQLLEVAGVEPRSRQVPEDLGVLGFPEHQRAHARRDAVQVRRGGLRNGGGVSARCGPAPPGQAPPSTSSLRPEGPSPSLAPSGSFYPTQTPSPPRSLPASLFRPSLARGLHTQEQLLSDRRSSSLYNEVLLVC